MDDPKSVNAQTVPYTYDFNATNLYTNDVIFYEFSGLDAAQSYAWGIWTVDINTGQPIDRIHNKIKGPGATTHSFVFGAGILSDGRWPEDYIGPIYVIDNFGFTLHKHFVHPPINVNGDPIATQEWESSLGAFTFQEKQVFGNHVVAPNDCQSVVFNTINPNGHHFGFNPCQVTTTIGDYAILHYQFDPVGYSSPTTDAIITISLDEGTGLTIAMNLDLDNLATFQFTSGSTGAPTFTAFDSFIIVNTGEDELPWINYERADFAFGLNPLLNPMRFGDDNGPITLATITGAYGCYRIDGAAAIVADCEAPWIISNDPTPDSSFSSAEWDLTLLEDVSESGTQIATHRQFTSAVWDAYHGAMLTVDVYSGFSDATVYAFSPLRTTLYTVNNTANDIVVVAWLVDPVRVPFAAVDVIPLDYQMITLADFDIKLDVTIEEAIEEAIRNVGLDTELGRTILHGILLMLSLVFVAFIPVARESLLSYLISWTAIGGIFVVADFASDFSTLMWSLITILMWILAFTVFKGSLGRNSEETDNA